jgi:hypothetical protein
VGCPDIETDLDCQEALLVLEPFFLEIQDIFVREARLTRCARTELYCAPWVHDSPRHFAACRDDGRVIVVAPEMAELPVESVVGIMSHEFGHAADYLYPAQFTLDSDHKAARRQRREFGDTQWIRLSKAWSRRDEDLVELTADAVAELATGNRIGYLGPCQLQAFDRGKARPQGLR